MTTKKRHNVKLQIQQRPRESWIERNKNKLITGGVCVGFAACSSLYALGVYSTTNLTRNAPHSTPTTISTQVATNTKKLPALSVAAAPKIITPEKKKLKLGSGDTLLGMLTETGVSSDEAHEAVAAIREIYDPKRLNRGQQVAINLDASEEDPTVPSIKSLSLPISNTTTLELKRKGNGDFTAKKIEAESKERTVYKKLPIRGSFYETAANAGLSPQIISELIKAYSYDVDFQRDVKAGHFLEIVVDRKETADGKVVSARNLRFAALTLGKKKIGVYRYTDKNGHTAYYNANGESLRKALLRTPINGARISSGFGMRKHPVLGYSKMHRGVDFAASIGTPIYAAGDGVIEFAGWKGGYGNFVKVKHNGTYATGYGHASRIAKGIKPGVRVKQGQVIAYVGSTGRSTGPHLHYEVFVNNTQVNPSGVKFRTGNALAGNDLKKFKAQVASVQALMKNSGEKEQKVANTQPTAKKKNGAKKS